MSSKNNFIKAQVSCSMRLGHNLLYCAGLLLLVLAQPILLPHMSFFWYCIFGILPYLFNEEAKAMPQEFPSHVNVFAFHEVFFPLKLHMSLKLSGK